MPAFAQGLWAERDVAMASSTSMGLGAEGCACVRSARDRSFGCPARSSGPREEPTVARPNTECKCEAATKCTVAHTFVWAV